MKVAVIALLCFIGAVSAMGGKGFFGNQMYNRGFYNPMYYKGISPYSMGMMMPYNMNYGYMGNFGGRMGMGQGMGNYFPRGGMGNYYPKGGIGGGAFFNGGGMGGGKGGGYYCK